jgi:hypothetical protein
MWRPKLVGLVGLALALVIPGGAGAAVTIGSNLGRAPDGIMASEGCSPPCTLMQDTLAPDRQASGGVTSPVNGTVVLWRLRVGGSTTPTSLRVIDHLAGGLATGAGTSATVTPALNSQSSFPTSLPIRIGQSIGITCCQPVAEYFVAGGGSRLLFSAPFTDGGPGEMGSGTSPKEIALNADIEPTSAFTVDSVRTVKNGSLLITANLPNPGTLVAGDKLDAGIAASAKKKRKPMLLKRASVNATAPGPVVIRVSPAKAAKLVLRRGKRVKAGLRVAFTPTGGKATSQALKVKLRP